jgi:hypothetical protein
MKSNLVKQIVKPFRVGRSLKWRSRYTTSVKQGAIWESDRLDKLWRGSTQSSPWPEILPPQMDDRYFDGLKLSIVNKIKAKRFQVD